MSGARRPAMLLLSLLALTGGARAEAGDYALDADSWNGVGYLLVTAEEARVKAQVQEALDLHRLRPGDVLLWLYPTGPLPVDGLVSFVNDGGYLIVADDHGHADALLERFGIRREARGPTSHARWYQGQEGLPVAEPRPDKKKHFLFYHVDEVVSNYPSLLRGAGEAILSFDRPEDRLVVERPMGRGALLAISDPSIFVNQMLRRFYGNKQFAANVMRLYCDRDPCELTMLRPHALAFGTYRERSGPLGEIPRIFDNAAELINEALASLSDALAKPPWAALLGGLALLLGIALTFFVLAPGRRPAPGLASRSAVADSPFVQEAIGLAASSADADFNHLARTLVVQVDQYAAAGLLPDPRHAPEVEPDPRDGLALSALLRIRKEADSLQGPSPPMVTAERFVRMYDDVRLLADYVDRRGQRHRRGRALGLRSIH